MKMAEEMMNKHNVDVLGDYMAEDITDHNPPTGSKPGLEGIKEAMKMFLGAFPDLNLQVDDLIAEGDLVVCAPLPPVPTRVTSWAYRPLARRFLMKKSTSSGSPAGKWSNIGASKTRWG